MKVMVGGVEILLDENNNSDGHHKFQLASDDFYFDLVIHQDNKVFGFLLDKYKMCKEFDFGELDKVLENKNG